MKKIVLIFGLAFTVFACDTKNKALERRVEALENKLSAMTPVAQSAPVPVNENIVAEEATNIPLAAIDFKERVFDFGTFQEGKVVNHTFTFTNTGNSPLIIQNASASCGCTVPVWPKEPIAPGGSGVIKVEFDSKGKLGVNNKTVTITANTDPNPTILTIKSNVLPGKDDSQGPLKN